MAAQRLLDLIDYVVQCSGHHRALASGPGRFSLALAQLEDVEGVRLDATDTGEPVWLRMERPPNPVLPPRVDSPWLAPWLAVGPALVATPHLAASVLGEALIAAGTHRDASVPPAGGAATGLPAIGRADEIALATYPFRAYVERELEHYIGRRWAPWAEAERKRRRASRLYMQFVSLHQELTGALSDGHLEIVWGFGLVPIAGAAPDARYPLIVQPVDLSIAPEAGVVRIVPKPALPRLDLEPFAADRAEAANAERAADLLFSQAEVPFSPFDLASAAPVIDLARTALPEGTPVELSWVLFARARNSTPMLRDLERFAQALRTPASPPELPPAVAALVNEPGDTPPPSELPRYRGVSAIAVRGDDRPVRDLYFPLPFNDEQMRIVQLLEARDGVVVQGPPGTGKTHTIANVICHWLAHGRRVLVTSMKEPALAVLRDKLPEELQPLALALLAGDADGLEAFERAIQHIAAQVQALDTVAAAESVGRLEHEIDALQSMLADIDSEVVALAAAQFAPVVLDGERIEARDAAAAVADSETALGWLTDTLGPEPKYEPQFDDADLARLFGARAQLGVDLRYAGMALPRLEALPEPPQLLDAHRRLVRLAQLSNDVGGSDTPILATIDAGTFGKLAQAAAAIEQVRMLRSQAAQQQTAWSADYVARIADPGSAQAVAAYANLASEVREIAAAYQPFASRPVAVPPGAEFDVDVLQAVRNLAAGRRAFGLARMFRPEARARLAGCFIEGNAPASPEEWQHVSDMLAVRIRWRTLAPRWNTVAGTLCLPRIAADEKTGIAEAAANVSLTDKLAALEAAEAQLAAVAQALFPGWSLARRLREEPAAIRGVERAVDHYLNAQQLADVWKVREQLREALASASGGVFDDIRRFTEDVLGQRATSDDAVVHRWFGLLAEVKRLHALSEPLDTVARVTAAIERSGAPKLAAVLREPSALPRDALMPADWREGWRLRRLATHLARVEAGARVLELSARRTERERDLARATRTLVVQRAWLRLAEKATPGVRAALQAYLSAVQRLGKGTGKRAARYRQDAREAAALAQAAIPCWIMPHYRVSDSLPSQFGAFDLIVIDEASQSDLSALPALLRGVKFLIVGDDRQVSPDPVGLEEERIRALMQRHLASQVPVYRMQMSPERSVYDLARVVFAASSVMLKEHFRCVAPIIAYAKREFYGDELRPLRVPLRSRRLDPPLMDVIIEGAERTGDLNAAEAAYIVEDIARVTADPKMRGRTIGVVSLLGEEQAARIFAQLADRLGPAVLQEFAIACGDAKAFQGRERDIMYLSMVVAPNAVGAPLARDTFAQRFNVAASRARDRMVLVRSVRLEHLSDADRLRAGLIAHFHEPFGRPEPTAGLPLRDRCETPLERSLFDWLAGHGYRVTPRVQVGTGVIDLIVEGSDDTRLAIECDGDRTHDATHWVADIGRQRVLERAGWAFHRCFATRFVLMPDTVFAELEAALASRGVLPLGTSAEPAAGITAHRFADARALLATVPQDVSETAPA